MYNTIPNFKILSLNRFIPKPNTQNTYNAIITFFGKNSGKISDIKKVYRLKYHYLE